MKSILIHNTIVIRILKSHNFEAPYGKLSLLNTQLTLQKSTSVDIHVIGLVTKHFDRCRPLLLLVPSPTLTALIHPLLLGNNGATVVNKFQVEAFQADSSS